MSALESKAKTTQEIAKMYDDLAPSHHQWVPLEEAQKREQELLKMKNDTLDALQEVTNRCFDFKYKIVEANKILDELLSIIPKGQSINIIINTKELWRLDEVLK